jgi:hypothetical protein
MAPFVAERRTPKVTICRFWIDIDFLGGHCVYARPDPIDASSNADKNRTPDPAFGVQRYPPLPDLKFWRESSVGNKALFAPVGRPARASATPLIRFAQDDSRRPGRRSGELCRWHDCCSHSGKPEGLHTRK